MIKALIFLTVFVNNAVYAEGGLENKFYKELSKNKKEKILFIPKGIPFCNKAASIRKVEEYRSISGKKITKRNLKRIGCSRTAYGSKAIILDVSKDKQVYELAFRPWGKKKKYVESAYFIHSDVTSLVNKK